MSPWACECVRGDESGVRELWRLRMNWVFVAALSVLATTSNTSISSSFHQFVINPPADKDNHSSWSETAFGMGESESFYSWLIAVFNFGSVFGAIVSGFLVHCVPYWHLFAISLVTHITGFTLYAVTYKGWLILISKFLSGYFIGAQWSLSIGYTAKSAEEYVGILRGVELDRGSVEKVKRYVFSSQAVGVAIGFVVGPGAAVIFAQFPIDQFRAIAWYNIVMGTVLLLLQLVLFRGEAGCRGWSQIKTSCHCPEEVKSGVNNGLMGLFIVVTLLLFLVVAALRFGYFETLFNPVLSDSFGFDERDSSYYFLALAVPYLGGVLTLVILQRLALSNQLIAIIGIIMTFVACILSADWQSIPYDPCTQLSPFHHPEILNTSHNKNSVPLNQSISGFEIAPFGVKMNCTLTESCDYCNSSRLCLNYSVSTEHLPSKTWRANTELSLKFRCNTRLDTFSTAHHPLALSLCILYSEPSATAELAHVQELTVLSGSTYNRSKHNCEAANVSSCHWIPSSSVTHKECTDCQPICRGVGQTLFFWQFVLGTSTIMASLPILWVSLMAMASFQVRVESQGLLGGATAAVNSAARGIGPLILDAAYEGMQKRMFLAMLILLFLHVPMLLEILLLYKKLGPPPSPPPGPVQGGGYKTLPNTSNELSDLENND